MNSRLFQNLFGPRRVHWALLALFLIGCKIPEGLAQANSAPASPGNRYLVIFENSRQMEKRVQGAAQSLQQIIGGGFKGQVRRGDSLGVWTYNDQLYTGKFPLQSFSPETQNATASAVINFVTQQKCQKQAHFDKVMPSLQRIIENSELLTILIVSTGSDDIQGTPFDDAINASYKQWRTLQQQEHMPYVVLLRVQRGQITQHAEAPAPWPVEIPPMTVEPVQSVAKAKPALPAPKPPATTQSIGALVFSGKKTEPSSGTANSPVPTNAPALRAAMATASASTNAPVFAALRLAQSNPAAVPPQSSNMAATATVQTPKQEVTPAAPNVTTAAPTEIAAAVPTPPKTIPVPTETTVTNTPRTNALAISLAAQQPPPKQLPAPALEKAKPAVISKPVQTAEVPARTSVPAGRGESLLSSLGSIWLRLRFVVAAVVLVFAFSWFFSHQRRRAREAARPISLITRSLDRQTH